MRTYTHLLLIACTLVWGCKPDKNTPTPVTPEPVVLIDDIPAGYPDIILNTERRTFLNSQHLDSSLYYITSFTDVFDDSGHLKDIGGVSYNEVSLPRSQNPLFPNIYVWTDRHLAIANEGTWGIVANQFGPAMKLKDPFSFPEIYYYPDTIRRSNPVYTVRTDSVYEIELMVNYHTAEFDTYNYHNSLTNRDSLSTLLYVSAYDSVYVTIVAQQHTILYNDKAHFNRRSQWSKWVRVID